MLPVVVMMLIVAGHLAAHVVLPIIIHSLAVVGLPFLLIVIHNLPVIALPLLAVIALPFLSVVGLPLLAIIALPFVALPLFHPLSTALRATHTTGFSRSHRGVRQDRNRQSCRKNLFIVFRICA